MAVRRLVGQIGSGSWASKVRAARSHWLDSWTFGDGEAGSGGEVAIEFPACLANEWYFSCLEAVGDARGSRPRCYRLGGPSSSFAPIQAPARQDQCYRLGGPSSRAPRRRSHLGDVLAQDLLPHPAVRGQRGMSDVSAAGRCDILLTESVGNLPLTRVGQYRSLI